MVNSTILLSKINRRKIIKNLGQFASIIIITFLAVCLAVGLNSSAQTVEKKLDTLLEGSNFADGIMYGVLSNDVLSDLDGLDIEYQRRLEVSAKDKAVKLLVTDGISTINIPYTDNYNGGVYITHNMASKYDLNVGDTLSVPIDLSILTNLIPDSYFEDMDNYVIDGKENILATNNITLDFVIEGLMYHPEGITEEYPISLEYSDFTNSLKNEIEDNYIESTFTETLVSIVSVEVYTGIVFKGDIDLLTNNFNEDYFVIFSSEFLLLQLRNDIDQAYQLTYVFPVVFILVSILIIITTISQLIFKEKLNIATLKSIGITNKQIYMHYILLTISLCMIGGIIGAIVGPIIIPNVMGIKYNLIYSLPNVSNVYALFPIFSNIFLFVIISTIVSFFILRSSVNTLPATLIKNTGGKKFKKSKIEISSWSLKIALRNISQNIFRSLMVIIGVGGCGALFITGFGIDDTLNNTVDLEMYYTFNRDATISFDNYSVELRDKIKLDVNSYEEFSMVAGAIDSDIFNVTYIYTIDDNTNVFNNGDFDGVYITNKTSELFNLNINDVVIVKINNVKYEYTIDKIIDVGFSQGIYIPTSLAIHDYDVTNAWIDTDDQEAIDELLSSYDGISDVATNVEFKISCDEALGPISIIKITLQVFAVLLGIVVLYNLALLNYKERNRDIATLKVLGLTNLEIAKSLIYEMMILAILGSLFGLCLGYPMLVLLLSINEVDFISYIYKLNVNSYIYTFVFTTFTALIINTVLLKQINKIKMVESLKSVE
ncbi:MAG: FtsX-like permease family protein [bacterium]